MAMQRTKTPRTFSMSYEAFLEWADEDIHAEWVDGEVIQFMPPNIRHQRISRLLLILMTHVAETRNLGEVLTAPFEMKLSQAKSSREPDILFIATEHLDRTDDNRLNGPADLVVEIVSRESAGRDQVVKFREYADVGVCEYWIVDPRSSATPVRIFELMADQSYRLIEQDELGRLHSLVMPGLWLRPDWLVQDPLPRAIDLVKEVSATDTAP